MSGRASHRRNARIMKVLSLALLGLLAAAMLLALDDSYDPAVSTVLLLMAASVLFTVAATTLLLPAEQFGGGFCAGVYILYAGLVSVMVFLSGGISSELYLLYFPVLFAAALHGLGGVALTALAAVAAGYFLAVAPEFSGGMVAEGDPALVLFRLAAFALAGLFAAWVARGLTSSPTAEEAFVTDEDGSVLLKRVSGELEARRGEEVAVLLVDPGRRVDDPELLLERVRTRIAEPVVLGEGNVFGMVLGGVDDRVVESAARRALAAASSLGAEETRAGAAVYPRDARTPEDLLVAAGQALEAAFEVESPSAIVLASRLQEARYRAAR